MIQLPEHPLPAKPRFKEACNGCGLCCHVEICNIGSMAFPDAKAPCPGIHIADGRTWCKLVMVEKEHGLKPMIHDVLGVGGGCMMSDNELET